MIELGGGQSEGLAVGGIGAKAAARGKDVAEVAGQAFIDPEQFGLHRLLIVGRGKVGRAAVFAVPGMDHFVREQGGGKFAFVFVNEEAFSQAVVAGFMMFEAEMSDMVAEREQEVVAPIMMCAKEGVGLGDQMRKVADVFGFHFQSGGAVGHDVKLVRGLATAA